MLYLSSNHRSVQFLHLVASKNFTWCDEGVNLLLHVIIDYKQVVSLAVLGHKAKKQQPFVAMCTSKAQLIRLK